MSKVGLDMGTTNINVSELNSSGEPQIITNRMGQTSTRSVVYWPNEGEPIIGMEAENAALADPQNSVFDWKMNMGTDRVLYSKDGKDYTAKDVLAILLKNVKADIEAKTGQALNEAVITVPANYNQAQKDQTREAAKSVGIKVILMPHEPTAGALGNRVDKLKNAKVAVFDLGGGTLDISIIKISGNVSEVVATGGIQRLGGRNFNKRLADMIIDEFEKRNGYRPDEKEHAIFYQDLRNRAEQAKISLTAQTETKVVLSCNGDILNMTITRKQFETCTKRLLEMAIDKTNETLKEAGLTWDEIDVVYPIGGGSMMPMVIRELEKTSGKSITQSCEAYCAVAMGAAIAGRLEYERQGKSYKVGNYTLPPSNYFMRDILSRAVGVAVIDGDQSEKKFCSEILEKQTPIPSIQTKAFSLTHPKQTNVLVEILQGKEDQPIEECTPLGHFELTDLPQHNNPVGRIEVTFDIDANAMLTAHARDKISNKKAKLQIEYNNEELKKEVAK